MKTTEAGGFRYRDRQKGISLFVVLVILLLTMLVALWASRTALFSEMVTANDADYQRALERAQALVSEAQVDIVRGACIQTPPPVGVTCRPKVLPLGGIFYPESETEYLDMYATQLPSDIPSCLNGICFPGNVDNLFWKKEDVLVNVMQPRAASYGDYTGRTSGYLGAAGSAFYWVEILKYDKTREIAGGRAINFAPTAEQPFVFRITTVAFGERSTTRAVVQSIFVWRTVDS